MTPTTQHSRPDARPPDALLRLTVVAAQAAAIVVTWPLWQVREATGGWAPMLPIRAACELPQIPFGGLLLASLLLAAFRPRSGAIVHAVLLGLAILMDQTREQPHVLSLALLLFVALPHAGWRRSGAIYLAALWFWNGLGKLTSERWIEGGGNWLAGSDGASLTAASLAVSVGLIELSLGVLAMWQPTRALAGRLGCALHLGIAAFLICVAGDNPAVWSWNVALAIAAPRLLHSFAADPTHRAHLAKALAVLLPVGFHLGIVDAPLAQQVYTENSCHAFLFASDGSVKAVGNLPQLTSHLPATPRIFVAWFEHTANPGDAMVLVDDRPLAGSDQPRERVLRTTEASRP